MKDLQIVKKVGSDAPSSDLYSLRKSVHFQAVKLRAEGGGTNIDYIDIKWAYLQSQVVSDRSERSFGGVVDALPRDSQIINVRTNIDDGSFSCDKKWNKGIDNSDWCEDIHIKDLSGLGLVYVCDRDHVAYIS